MKVTTTSDRLDRLRQKLLDLTTNNRMLSYRHPAASCLRVIDELPGVLFKHLLEGQSLIFEPVPEPARRELDLWASSSIKVPRAGEPREVKRPDSLTWARHIGLDAQYDLPVEADDFERSKKHSDRKIQAPHYPEELDARLRKIRAAARTAIEESGANMLYLAFGFLEWREPGSERAHQAPLLLMPVELERESGRTGQYKTKIKWTGEEIQQNLSLRKKLDELRVALPELDEEAGLEAYLSAVRRSVKDKTDWLLRRYVTLGLFEFGKILLYLDLDPDRWPEDEQISEHPLVRNVLEGDGGISESGSGDPDNSDEAIRFRDLELELVDRADSSQSEALDAALKGNSLVIEGPPGTGKSQTITNLVAAALARGKTVLFVAEKLAALEVVRRRLRELELGEFCLELHSHKTKKTEALEDIADRLRLHVSKQSTAAPLDRLKNRRAQLTQYLDIIRSNAGKMIDVTVCDALFQAGRARRLLAADVKFVDQAHVRIDSAEELSWIGYIEAKSRLKSFAQAYAALRVSRSAYEHPWAGVSAVNVLPHDATQLSSMAVNWAAEADAFNEAIGRLGLATHRRIDCESAADTVHQLSSLREAASAAEVAAELLERRLSLKIPRTSEGAGLALMIIKLISSAPYEVLPKVQPEYRVAGGSLLLHAHGRVIDDARQLKNDLSSTLKDSAFLAEPDDLEEWSAALSQRGLFCRWTRRWREASKAWEQLCRPTGRGYKPQQRVETLEKLRRFLREHNAIRSNNGIRSIFGDRACNLEFEVAPFLEVSQWSDRVRESVPGVAGEILQSPSETLQTLSAEGAALQHGVEQIAKIGIEGRANSFWENMLKALLPEALVASSLKATAHGTWDEFVAAVKACAGRQRAFQSVAANFREFAGLHEGRWFHDSKDPSLSGVASRARLAAASPESLTAWLEFDRVIRLSEAQPEASLVEAAAASRVPHQKVDLAFDYLLFDAISRLAFKKAPQLLSLSGKSLDQLREEYRAIDAEVMELRRASIASQLLKRKPLEGHSSGLKSEQTEMALIRAELAKQKRHIPLRQLVGRAGRALQALKPCFMMGPLSVAQYIAPGTLKFDLVIMDEASQMRPEDAVGALARGGQAIIVGDPKQLPPTSFFDRVASSTNDGDTDNGLLLAEDSKSVLELASSIFPSRMLKWHYRSRHESLIAFSNRQFYKDQLIVFPSPATQAGRFGIGWNYVPEAATTAGVNAIEARAVAKAAARILLEHKGRSLGVVAMNIKQAQRISDEMAALANADRRLADAMAEAENDSRGEPFFVKNLENVQGDERDIIMISMTYGPSQEGGRVPQNFGPINQDTGWRRLNVLFTRAKERMEIFSSMRSTDIIPKEGGDRGPRSLKGFLEYAETGRLGGEGTLSDRPTGSEFEDAVIEGLRELGYDCVPQLGVANFFLDIAIRDPNHAGDFVAAVECDGAAYHSERSARDRDRLRQEILENLGWSILRVWSTDWFRNPDGELQRVSGELKRLIEARRSVPARPEIATESAEKHEGTNVNSAGRVRSTNTPREPAELSRPAKKSPGQISIDQARALLIDLREREIKVKFPDSDPTKGLLRKSMLDELLRKRPSDLEEFKKMIRLELREVTDPVQLREYQERVFDILIQTEPGA